MIVNSVNGYLSKYEGLEVDAAVERVQGLDAEFALKVDKSTTVNGMPLSGNVVITAESIGALPDSTTYGKSFSWADNVLSLRDQNGRVLSSEYLEIDLGRWGHIIGRLSDQEDLQNVLNSKQNLISLSNMLSSDLVDDTNKVHKFATSSQLAQITINQEDIEDINSLIPSQASVSNQLADKDFVNSSISTNTANFIGTFNSVAELEAYSGTLTNNDYAFVATTDSAGNTLYDRYKWNGSEWLFEYELNNSSFTAAQWASINSGANVNNIGQIATNASNISAIQSTINSYGDIVTYSASDFATAAQGALAETALQSIDSAMVTGALGYTPENQSNKVIAISDQSTDTQYPSAKLVYDQLQLKQDELVSGDSIKTINDISLLGSGNIEVLQNTATGDNSYSIGNATSNNNLISIGEEISSAGHNSVVIGGGTRAGAGYGGTSLGFQASSGSYGVSLGAEASSSQNSAIQIGYGTNSTANSLSVGFYNNTTTHYNWQLLNGVTGLIPDARISSNIARVSNIPSVYDSTITIQQNSSTVDSFTLNQATGKTINLIIPEDTGDLTNNAGYIKGIAWGEITGTLSNQTDLKAALDSKANTFSLIEGENIEIEAGANNSYTISFTNDSGFISGINSSDVVTALGYTPYSAANPNNYISGINSSDVVTALGYTPYSATNPNNYISSAALSTLTDVTLSNVEDGQHLVYDGVAQKWKNVTSSSSTAWGDIIGTLSDQADLQTALNSKQNTITGAATTITSDNLTGGRALISDSNGKVAVSTISSTKLGYLSDVTSNIQVQLNGKTTMSAVEAKGYLTSADLQGYQPLLVSGTNIKTINNQSILGSGNVDVSSITFRDWSVT